MLENEFKSVDLKFEPLYNDINYGVVLSFMNKFGKYLSLKEFKFDDFEESLLELNETKQNLKDFLWCLVRVTNFGKNLKKEKLNSCLEKFVHKSLGDEYKYDKEFYKLDLMSKLLVIKNLIDAQFDDNQRLKPVLNEQSSDLDGLRSKPIGRDIFGNYYWFYVDSEFNLRLFNQYSIDLNGFSWKLKARDVSQVEDLIEQLKKEPMLEKLKTSERYKKTLTKLSNKNEIPKQKRNTRKKSISESEPDNSSSDEISLKEIKQKLDQAHSKVDQSDNETSSTISNDQHNESRCTKCSKVKSEYMLIMCDSCDLVYHVDCLKPIFVEIPEGDWHCPICEHDQLIRDLKQKLTEISNKKSDAVNLKFLKVKKEEEEVKRKMEIKHKIESENLSKKFQETISSLETRKRACRNKPQINYTFEDYDRQIKEATGINNESDQEDKKSVQSFRINESEVSDDDDDDEKSEFEFDINKSYLSYDETDYESNENEMSSFKKNSKMVKKKLKRVRKETMPSHDETDSEYKFENSFRKFGLFRKRFKRVVQESDDEYTAYNEDDYFNQNFEQKSEI